ncbi:hypothetical protein BKA69DRAFT_1024783 [Paraphysoderma sedebokerense]|nr:hypothetical protein BKA69DRAFT_1024783 [Paraphysoderma sedebokerense]
MSSHKCLVYGGAGALGRSVVSFMKSKQWTTISVDLAENAAADSNIILSTSDSFEQTSDEISSQITSVLGGSKLDAIFCVAGGWYFNMVYPLNVTKDLIKNTEISYKQSVTTSIIAAHIAAHHLKENGLLTLTGSYAALKGTPGMIAYGMCKGAVHQLVKSLGAEGSGLPKGAKCVGILPITLDTPMNRKYMSSADFSTWTPLEFVASLLHDYATTPSKINNGALVGLVTKNSQTNIEVVTGDLLGKI